MDLVLNNGKLTRTLREKPDNVRDVGMREVGYVRVVAAGVTAQGEGGPRLRKRGKSVVLSHRREKEGGLYPSNASRITTAPIY